MMKKSFSLIRKVLLLGVALLFIWIFWVILTEMTRDPMNPYGRKEISVDDYNRIKSVFEESVPSTEELLENMMNQKRTKPLDEESIKKDSYSMLKNFCEKEDIDIKQFDAPSIFEDKDHPWIIEYRSTKNLEEFIRVYVDKYGRFSIHRGQGYDPDHTIN